MNRTPENEYVSDLHTASGDVFSSIHPATLQIDSRFGLLVALTDDQRAPAASEVAQAIAHHKNATPNVVYVIEIGVSIPEAAMVAVTLEAVLREPETRAAQEAKMREVLGLDVGERAAWPFSIEVGDVAAIVTADAVSRGAELIVMGLNRHAALGRVMGRDTARQVMARSTVPVLGVRDSLAGLPKRIVVAMDFSSASIRAARMARRLAADGGEIHMIFVESEIPGHASEALEVQRLIRREGVRAVFAHLCDELTGNGGVVLSSNVVASADTPGEVLHFCEKVKPDVIALGSQRRRLLGRLGMGSTAGAIANDGRWSVLVAPPTPEDEPKAGRATGPSRRSGGSGGIGSHFRPSV